MIDVRERRTDRSIERKIDHLDERIDRLERRVNVLFVGLGVLVTTVGLISPYLILFLERHP